jgi:hypothetical protein
MKHKHSKSRYGILVFSQPTLRQLQSQWQNVEPPPSPMRLTPETDEVPFFSATPEHHPRAAA